MIQLLLQFVKFGIVGVSNTIISYAVYSILSYSGIYYVIANIIAFVLSVLNSFFWNNRYVFKKTDGEERNFLYTLAKAFLSYAGTGLVLSNILLVLLVEKGNVSKYIAPLVILIITIPLNFLINKFWSFKTREIGSVDSKNEKD